MAYSGGSQYTSSSHSTLLEDCLPEMRGGYLTSKGSATINTTLTSNYLDGATGMALMS